MKNLFQASRRLLVLIGCIGILGLSACKKSVDIPPETTETAVSPVSIAPLTKSSSTLSIEPIEKCILSATNSTQWNTPSTCVCPAKFGYNQVSGLCDGYEPIPAGAVIATNRSVSGFVPPGACANDLNEWNNPSSCDCPPQSVYNQVSARCDTKNQ